MTDPLKGIALAEARARERNRYDAAYANPKYRMGADRFMAAVSMIRERPDLSESILDVGTGRGELLKAAWMLGVKRIQGTEVVPELLNLPTDPFHICFSNAWDLRYGNGGSMPDRGYQTVTCLDVLEHLLPEDAEPTMKELARVAEHRIIVTASNIKSDYGGDLGELHINRKPYEEWNADFMRWMPDWNVAWRMDKSNPVSRFWEMNR